MIAVTARNGDLPTFTGKTNRAHMHKLTCTHTLFVNCLCVVSDFYLLQPFSLLCITLPFNCYATLKRKTKKVSLYSGQRIANCKTRVLAHQFTIVNSSRVSHQHIPKVNFDKDEKKHYTHKKLDMSLIFFLPLKQQTTTFVIVNDALKIY